jgi:hypothetical protein
MESVSAPEVAINMEVRRIDSKGLADLLFIHPLESIPDIVVKLSPFVMVCIARLILSS